MPGRSELSSRWNTTVPFPPVSPLGLLLPLGRWRQGWANPDLNSAWVALAVCRALGSTGCGFRVRISFLSPQGVTRSLAQHWSLRLQVGQWGFWRSILQKVSGVSLEVPHSKFVISSEFPNPNLCTPRQRQCGESAPRCWFPRGWWSCVGNGLWCDEFKHLASFVSRLPGIRTLLSETYIISSLFAFNRE